MDKCIDIDTTTNCRFFLNKTDFNRNTISIDNTNAFSIIHINARSFIHNHENIENYIYELTCKCNIIIISESWMKETDIGNYELCNYNAFHTIRKNKRGGVVSIFVKNSFKSQVLNNLRKSIDNLLDILTLQILTNDNKKILISGIYNSPTSSITNFTNFIINNFTRLLTNDIFYAEILTLIFHGLMIIIFYIL